MCNAWNHSPDCTCGWGGDGYLASRRNVSAYARLAYTGRFAVEYSSYTNPNSTCPKCGKRVFFYQSPSGGQVFFDELGPPWPKHPCTSYVTSNPAKNYASYTSRPRIFINGVECNREWLWQTQGWRPYLVHNLTQLRPDFRYCQIQGELENVGIILYARQKDLERMAPFLVRRIDGGKYEISTMQFGLPRFNSNPNEIRFFAYTTPELAQEAQNRLVGDKDKRYLDSKITNKNKRENRKSIRAEKRIEGSLQESLKRFVEARKKRV